MAQKVTKLEVQFSVIFLAQQEIGRIMIRIVQYVLYSFNQIDILYGAFIS